MVVVSDFFSFISSPESSMSQSAYVTESELTLEMLDRTGIDFLLLLLLLVAVGLGMGLELFD